MKVSRRLLSMSWRVLGMSVLGSRETMKGEARHAAYSASPDSLLYVTWGPTNTRA